MGTKLLAKDVTEVLSLIHKDHLHSR
jgi:hypothetical protein